MACIEARGLRKLYGSTVALDGIDLTVQPGRILGLIGPNGAGKSTALNAILGLTDVTGDLKVLGRDPRRERDALMSEVAFIADVAVLPRWLKVTQALAYLEGVHPRFDRRRADALLARTAVRREARVGQLSKGMVTQLHLALVMAIDARLLVLDEPTIGLDILFRKQFYDTLLNDYFDERRTIIVTTHQVEELEHILTDLMFIDGGRIVLDGSMETVQARFCELMAAPDRLAEARGLRPIRERQLFGRSILLFDNVPRERLATLGEVRAPSIGDLFVAVIGGGRRQRPHRPRQPPDRSRRMSLETVSTLAAPDFGAGGQPRAPVHAARPFLWSVRRELWEHRAVVVAPVLVAAFVLVGLAIAAVTFPPGVDFFAGLDPARQTGAIAAGLAAAGFPIDAAGTLVALLYCVGALHGERRDRSILFWKSLPVSDTTTVLAKAAAPLAVVPAVVFATILATRVLVLLLAGLVLLAGGHAIGPILARVSLAQLTVVPLYGVIVSALWLAPVYGVLLLVSAWVKRAPLVWVLVPPFAAVLIEATALHSGHIARFIGWRLSGADTVAYARGWGGDKVISRLDQLDPAGFLTSPDLWLGLIAAAAFIAGAIWVRRRRDPV